MGGGGGGRSAIARGQALRKAVPIEVKRERGGIAVGPVRPEKGEGGILIPEEIRVYITKPENNKTVSGKIEIKVKVSGGRGSIDTIIQLNGKPIGHSYRKGEWSLFHDTIGDSNGKYELRAIVCKATNREKILKESKPISLTINNRGH